MTLWTAIRDVVLGKDMDLPTVIDVSPAMRQAIEVRGAFDPDRVPPYLQSRSANWGAVATTDRLLDTARKSVVVYACLSYLADAVAESPLRVYRSVRGERTETPDHRARQILANPNPFMSEAEFVALVVMAMGMQGYAVVEKVRSPGGLPVQLWPLRPDWLTPRLAVTGQYTESYDYRPPGLAHRIIPETDVILIPFRHDDRLDSPGVSPLQIAAREIGIDSALTEFLKTFLDAGGIPPFVIEYSDPISDPAIIEQMQEMWAQKYGGSKAYGKLPILHGGYKIAKIGDGINDMAWPDLRAITEDKICQAFRVPRELVQTRSTATGGSGLTTTEQEGAMASLQRYGATPLRNRIDGALSRAFLSEFTGGDPQYELAFDVSDVLSLQEDADKRHARVRADYQAGLVMLDEARQELGMQPLPSRQGEVFAVPFSVVFTRPAELAAPALTPSAIPAQANAQRPAQRAYRDLKALAPDELEMRANVLNRNRRDQRRLADVLNRKLRGFFTAQADRLAAALEKAGSDPETKIVTDLDWQEEEDLLSAILRRFYAEAGGAAASAASSALGVTIDWDLSNPNINRTMTQLGTRIRGIAETTREDVARVIADGLTNGQGLPEIADQVRELVGGDSYKGRAMTIARTESQVSYNTASIVSYQESGVVESAELADNIDHDEDYGASDGLTCATRNGLTVPLANVHIHIEAEHPNGSLGVLPVVTLGEE